MAAGETPAPRFDHGIKRYFGAQPSLAGNHELLRLGWRVCIFQMEIRNRETQVPFTTQDGSTIRSLLDMANAPVEKQSLAEASLSAGAATDRHYHRCSEEFYYLLEGRGMMEISGEEREVKPGDAVLIPAGAWHQIRAIDPLRFLCCCAPPYSHDDTFFI